ncbi:nitroreductase/quinone reductase family protein [Nonomuraea typhae]|uniref:nitroreductase/quinone reductase family protein n=1 Tax=Nonomuraea typhae TaxID=2603600 RepID=UPI0012F74583|nr:nitroreductase/quinone reductase family protein [Nonomuraea typhae]
MNATKDLTITTIGRKTGRLRTTTHPFGADGDQLVLVGPGSAAGPHLPGWYQDLMAHPDAEVQLDGRRLHVRAHTAHGPERRRLWTKLVAAQPVYQRYAEAARGEIPVVVLEATA